uniref:Uncharacterized protein n=1 Tax=Anopheles quadriannulatus TaxID=34691 RepID=A0A182XS80_ANOQN
MVTFCALELHTYDKQFQLCPPQAGVKE